MRRPVPAAPSPGASWRRAKLSEADRQRISTSMAARFKDKPPKPERVGIAYRFTRGDQEWAVLNDGSRWCFRAGEYERGAIVAPKYGPVAGRPGVVTSIVETWEGQVSVCVWFKAEKRPIYDHETGTVRTAYLRPGAFWHPDALEILGHIDKPEGKGR